MGPYPIHTVQSDSKCLAYASVASPTLYVFLGLANVIIAVA
jgi:hypothetical protein